VHVYEQVRAFREVGAGININPNASRVLHSLGLGEKITELGVLPLRFISADGMTAARCALLRTPLGADGSPRSQTTARQSSSIQV
jgi:salicylate hydroxylase